MARAKALRCAYVDDGLRCRRNGTGNPPLCARHRDALEQARQQSPRGIFAAVSDVLGEFFATGTVSEATVRKATQDAMRSIQDSMGQVPDGGPDQRPRQTRPRVTQGPWTPPTWPPPPPRNWQGPWPPRNAPQVSEDELALRRARKVLGFAPGDVVTEEAIKARKRELALKHHPDKGGNPAAMAAINDAADVLMAAVS